MPREIDWLDSEEIGILLQEKYPETEPYSFGLPICISM